MMSFYGKGGGKDGCRNKIRSKKNPKKKKQTYLLRPNRELSDPCVRRSREHAPRIHLGREAQPTVAEGRRDAAAAAAAAAAGFLPYTHRATRGGMQGGREGEALGFSTPSLGYT